MTLVKLNILPGIFSESSDLGTEGRWKSGNRVRFRHQTPEKIGGWQKNNSAQAVQGDARGMLPWSNNVGDKSYIAVGTSLKLYVWFGGNFFDATPNRIEASSGAVINATAMVVVSGFASVLIHDTGHGAIVNDFVNFPTTTTPVTDVPITGEYQITNLVDANSFYITTTHTATGSATATEPAGNIGIDYEINTGGGSGLISLGWGASTWGASTWGTARSSGGSVFTFPRTWTFDTWGEDLISCPRGGGIYTWDSSAADFTEAPVGSTAFANIATLVSNSPTTATSVIVSPESRHLVALGAHDGTNNAPMNVRWSSREDNTTWTDLATNTAGSRLLESGSVILGAVKARNEITIFTDTSIYTMQFIGGNDVFSFKLVDDSAAIISPHAAAAFNGIVYWMGQEDFFIYDGRNQVLDCDVRRHVFDNVNPTNRGKVFSGVNRAYQEVWWFYPSLTSEEVDLYVAYNFIEETWHTGSLDRTAWADSSEATTIPVAMGTSGHLYEHETGKNDDGVGMDWSLSLGDIDVVDGEEFIFINRFVPDFQVLDANINITINVRRYPKGDAISKGPFSVSSSTKKIDMRARGRQLSIDFSSSAVDQDMRMGTFKIDIRPDGKR